jgi:hypothetical protein
MHYWTQRPGITLSGYRGRTVVAQGDTLADHITRWSETLIAFWEKGL